MGADTEEGSSMPPGRYTGWGLYLTALRPKAMPSSGPRLMVVRAKRRAGACTLRAFTLLALPFPLRARYTDACRVESCCEQKRSSIVDVHYLCVFVYLSVFVLQRCLTCAWLNSYSGVCENDPLQVETC